MTTNPNILLERCATCSASCPVRTDTRAYVDLIAQGKYEEAFEKIRESNPFPSVCSLICHHPCEEACRRGSVDEAVALRNLKRFAVERALEYRERRRHRVVIRHPETVAVVGSGPAGLTVAHDCIRKGYAVTVYESLPKAGGLLACAIPKYRLPENALQHDLDDILALGVEVRTGVTVGADVSLRGLQERHEAVVLAVGLSQSRSLPMEHGDHPDVLLAIPFLRAVALGRPVEVREQVIVVGGGNVAVDVARTAIRLGAISVATVCLENEEEMPAWDWECREALDEGIQIVHRRGPTQVLVEDGNVAGLEVREVERVFDEHSAFSPTYFDDRRSIIPGQMVVVAIGQRSDLGLLRDTAVRVTERGLLAFDRAAMATSAGGVFACGELVTGPGSAIEAVASGHRAARAVINFFRTGKVLPLDEPEVDKLGELPEELRRKIQRIHRMAMPTLSPEQRRRSFVQFELGYSEEQALKEARRCLSCAAGAVVDEQKCDACLACLRVCPFGVPVMTEVATMCSETCQACGLCAVECPARAIRIQRFAVGDIRDRIAVLLRNAPRRVGRVEIVCAGDAENREALQDRILNDNGGSVARIPVSCAARAEEVDMMKPFELGADAVVIRRCGRCLFRGAEDRLAKRVGRTRELLQAAGIGADRLTLL